MKIKKIDEELKYKQIDTEHTFEINGKSVRVREYQKQDMLFEDYESDTTINEKDLEKLTDEEAEELENYMTECLDLEKDTEFDTEA